MSETVFRDIRFVYFDLDDTLLDHKSAQMKALDATLSDFKFSENISSEEFKNAYHLRNKELWHQYNHGRITQDELRYRRFAETLEELGLDTGLFEKVESRYMHHYEHSWDWVPGAEVAYGQIRKSLPAGVVTNGFAKTQYKKIRKFGLVQNGEKTVISEEVGYLKPHPAIFKYAVEIAGVQPHQVLYVGDSFNSDIEGGKAAGLRTAWYNPDSPSSKPDEADLVFDDFKILANQLPV